MYRFHNRLILPYSLSWLKVLGGWEELFVCMVHVILIFHHDNCSHHVLEVTQQLHVSTVSWVLHASSVWVESTCVVCPLKLHSSSVHGSRKALKASKDPFLFESPNWVFCCMLSFDFIFSFLFFSFFSGCTLFINEWITCW